MNDDVNQLSMNMEHVAISKRDSFYEVIGEVLQPASDGDWFTMSAFVSRSESHYLMAGLCLKRVEHLHQRAPISPDSGDTSPKTASDDRFANAKAKIAQSTGTLITYGDHIHFGDITAFEAEIKAKAALQVALGRLEKIKGLVCGEAHPHWDGQYQTANTRSFIADLCDSAFAQIDTILKGHQP